MKRKEFLTLSLTALAISLAMCLSTAAEETTTYQTTIQSQESTYPAAQQPAIADLDHAVMHLDGEKLKKRADEYKNAPRAEGRFKKAPGLRAAPSQNTVSLLDQINYNVNERNQGYCGDCWAWAGTGVLEVALDQETGIKDRLSIQYLQSNYNNGQGSGYACCGGSLNAFANFYRGMGKTVPWSNTNANYQDYSKQCGNSASIGAAQIGGTPYYGLTSIQDYTITTRNAGSQTAVSNVKSILDAHKAIFFAFYAPTQDDGNRFISFWNNNAESDLWNPNYACGHNYNTAYGWGHAVLIVGYDDTDPANSYWIALNSWGATAKRPSGLFRINMSMNYDCVFNYAGYAYTTYNFQTLDVAYTVSGTTTTVPATSSTSSSTSSTSTVPDTTPTSTTVPPTTTIPATTTTAPATTSTSTTTTTTTTLTKCWSAGYQYLYRDAGDAKKFCKCAAGSYAYGAYDYYTAKRTAYRYADSGNNNNWAATPTSYYAAYSVRCGNGRWYNTNKDYYR